MKKLMLLAAMLTMVMVAAIPALAQNIEPTTGVEPGDEDVLICLLPEGCHTDAGIEPIYDDIEPVHDEIEPVDGDIEPAPGDFEPAPGFGDFEPVYCSEALEGSFVDRRASEPASVPDGTSIIPAEEPGCFAIPTPATNVSDPPEPLYW